MASYTSKLNLKKPDATDFYNIKDFNDNMVKIDEHKHTTNDITDFHASDFLSTTGVDNPTEPNIDKYVTSGKYSIGLVTKFINLPVSDADGTLEVKVHGTYISQTYTTSNGVAYTRMLISQTTNWKPWTKVSDGGNPLTTILSPSSNLDTVLISGFYRLDGMGANIPANSGVSTGQYSYGVMIVVRGIDTFTQIIFPYTVGSSVPLIRSGVTSKIDTYKFDYFKSGDSDKLGGIPASSYVKFMGVGNAFIPKESTSNEGGQITFEKADNSALFGNPFMDLFQDKFRFVCPTNGGFRVADLRINDTTKAESIIATFTAGTTDATAGSTNLGKNQLYVVYE